MQCSKPHKINIAIQRDTKNTLCVFRYNETAVSIIAPQPIERMKDYSKLLINFLEHNAIATVCAPTHNPQIFNINPNPQAPIAFPIKIVDNVGISENF